MGQKINPIGLRLGINRTWESRWYANTSEYGDLLHQDLAIRNFLEAELKAASVARIIIERPHKTCRITIYTARFPCAVNTEAQANWINLLTHYAASLFASAGTSSCSRTIIVNSENGFKMRAPRPRARARKRFMTRFLPT